MTNQSISRKKELYEYGFKENGKLFWWASWYAEALGYSSLSTLKKAIYKAQKNCFSLNMAIEDHFIPSKNNGKADFKLSKFACFMISLTASDKKPYVKRARVYFLNQIREVNSLLIDENFLNRMKTREDLKELVKPFQKMAKRSNIKDFQLFNNEGYIGLYNMSSEELREFRGLPKNTNLLEHMDQTELAINIFRMAITKERLKRLKFPSEQRSHREHWLVSDKIRHLVKESLGINPEELKTKKSLLFLQNKLKEAAGQMDQIEESKIADLKQLER